MRESVLPTQARESKPAPFFAFLSRFPLLAQAAVSSAESTRQVDFIAQMDAENDMHQELYLRAQQAAGEFQATRVRYEPAEGRFRIRYVAQIPLESTGGPLIRVETRIHAMSARTTETEVIPLLRFEAREAPLVKIEDDGDYIVVLPLKDKSRIVDEAGNVIMHTVIAYPYLEKIDYPLR